MSIGHMFHCYGNSNWSENHVNVVRKYWSIEIIFHLATSTKIDSETEKNRKKTFGPCMCNLHRPPAGCLISELNLEQCLNVFDNSLLHEWYTSQYLIHVTHFQLDACVLCCAVPAKVGHRCLFISVFCTLLARRRVVFVLLSLRREMENNLSVF